MLARIYQLVNILSLDVAAGSVVSALFLADILHETLLPQGLLVLAITVWLIYTADHLLDAKRIKLVAASERHRFHQQHFKILCAAWVFFGALDLCLIFIVRKPIVISGLYFSIAVVIYLLVSRWLVFLKELAAGLLYSGGVLLPSWTLHQTPIAAGQWTLIFQFVIVVLINLILFAWMSCEQDKHDSQQSFSTLLGKRVTYIVLLLLFILQFGLSILSINQHNWIETLLLNLMTIALLIIFLSPRYFQRNDRFRWGDLVFLFPILGVLF